MRGYDSGRSARSRCRRQLRKPNDPADTRQCAPFDRDRNGPGTAKRVGSAGGSARVRRKAEHERPRPERSAAPISDHLTSAGRQFAIAKSPQPRRPWRPPVRSGSPDHPDACTHPVTEPIATRVAACHEASVAGEHDAQERLGVEAGAMGNPFVAPRPRTMRARPPQRVHTARTEQQRSRQSSPLPTRFCPPFCACATRALVQGCARAAATAPGCTDSPCHSAL